MKSLFIGVLLIASFTPSTLAKGLEFWLSSPSDLRYYTEMLTLYREKVDPDAEISFSVYGFRELPDKMAVAIRTKTNAPDIVQLDEAFFGAYLRGTVPFVDLSERLESAGIKNDFLRQRLALFSQGESIYGLPQSVGATVLYYRRDLFERYGISPDNLKTWDDFMTVGRDLAGNGQAMLAVDPGLFEIMLRQRGSHLFDAEGNLFPDFDVAVDTLERLAEMLRLRIALIPDRSSVFDPAFFTSDVANNEIMSIVGADWYGLDMIQSFSQDLEGKWGIMRMPAWNETANGAKPIRVSSFSGQGLLIFDGSPKIEEAWQFMKFVMTDREANIARYTSGNCFPAYRPVFDEEALLAPNAFFGGDSFGELFVGLADDIPTVAMNAKRPFAVMMLREGLLSSVLSGQRTAAEALNELKAQLENYSGN